MPPCLSLSLCLRSPPQVRDGSEGREAGGSQEDAQRVPELGFQQKGLQGNQNALLLPTRERLVSSGHPAATAHRLLQGNVSLGSDVRVSLSR